MYRELSVLPNGAVTSLVILVELIIGCTIQDVQAELNSKMACKSFKVLAKEFRGSVADTVLVSQTKTEWTELYEDVKRTKMTDMLIAEGQVVSVEQVSYTHYLGLRRVVR